MRPTYFDEVPLADVPKKILDRLAELPVVRGQTLPGRIIPITEDKAGRIVIQIIELPN